MNKLVLKSVSIEIEAFSAGRPEVCDGKPQKATIQCAGVTYEFDVIFTHCHSTMTWPGPGLCTVTLKAEGHSGLEVES